MIKKQRRCSKDTRLFVTILYDYLFQPSPVILLPTNQYSAVYDNG